MSLRTLHAGTVFLGGKGVRGFNYHEQQQCLPVCPSVPRTSLYRPTAGDWGGTGWSEICPLQPTPRESSLGPPISPCLSGTYLSVDHCMWMEEDDEPRGENAGRVQLNYI